MLRLSSRRVATVTNWERYFEPGIGPVRFVLEQTVLVTGERLADVIDRDPWIRDNILMPIFAVNDSGLPVHRDLWKQLHRGSGKTLLIAATSIADILLHENCEWVCAASDKDQASLLIQAANGLIRRNPLLDGSLTVTKDIISAPSTGSQVRIISSDAASSFGLAVDRSRFRAVCEELTVWQPSGEQLYDSLITTTTKLADSQLIIVSNAGVHRTWQEAVKDSVAESGYYYAPQGVIASFADHDRIEQIRKSRPAPVYQRLYLNEWVSESGSFVSRDQYRACVDPELRAALTGEAGRGYYAGLDLGLTRDATALAVISRDRKGGTMKLDSLQVWQGSKGEPVSIVEIERALLDLSRRYPGVRVACDPWQLKGSLERLRGRVRVVEFPMSAASVSRLSQTLYSAITGKAISLYEDDDLEHEVLTLQTKQTAGGWRADHGSTGHNDRSTALSLAIQAALDHPHVSALQAIRGLETDEEIAEQRALWAKREREERCEAGEEVDQERPEPPPLTHLLKTRRAFFTASDAFTRDFVWPFKGATEWVSADMAQTLLASGDFDIEEVKEIEHV